MREQQVAKTIFDKVAKRALELRIESVQIALGELFELDHHILQQCWREMSRGTLLEQAKLHFRLIAAEVQCMACFQKYHPLDGKIHCPHCGSFGAKILAGEEFFVEHIETEAK